jgi:hypothetical protein
MKAQRVIKIWLYSFFNLATRWGGCQRHVPAVSPQGKRPSTHCIWTSVGAKTGLDGCRKSHPHRDSIPGAFRPQRVAVPTTLPRPIPPNGGRFPAVRHHSQAIIGSHHRTSMFYQVSSRPAIFKRSIRRHNTLTVPFGSWMTKQRFYTFPLDGEIRVRMPTNETYGGNLFSETPLNIIFGFLPQTEHWPSQLERPTCYYHLRKSWFFTVKIVQTIYMYTLREKCRVP